MFSENARNPVHFESVFAKSPGAALANFDKKEKKKGERRKRRLFKRMLIDALEI